jgi:hypothetical protein
MQTEIIQGIQLIFGPSEAHIAGVISDASTKSLHLIHEDWGLDKPQDCRIYIMSSWFDFVFRSAPWLWKILLAITFPLWFFRARRTWPYAGAWTQRFGKRVVIGIKPPRVLELSDKSFGLQMYVPETDPGIKIQQFTCHELTHACAAHLKLPAWLNEGIAMLTVDRYRGKATIRTDTLDSLRRPPPLERPPNYAQLTRMKADVVLYYTLLGYWLVRYLEEEYPGFLKSLFSSKLDSGSLEREVTRKLKIDLPDNWSKISDLITGFYGKHLATCGGD